MDKPAGPVSGIHLNRGEIKSKEFNKIMTEWTCMTVLNCQTFSTICRLCRVLTSLTVCGRGVPMYSGQKKHKR